MNNTEFEETLLLEIMREEHLLENAERFLHSAPRGYLNVKTRKNGNSNYIVADDFRGEKRYRKEININGNEKLAVTLMQKRIQAALRKRCRGNLQYLKKLESIYESVDIDDIVKLQAPKYQNILKQRKETMIQQWLAADYSKCPYDPRFHKHETDCGEIVRSKSEQILTNTLYAYGIPFHYEEEFIYAKGNIGKVFPDFTIILPNGRVKRWEHLGLLSEEDYCQRNAKKLNIYQMNGLVIGGNLILTMDDNKGNFSSSIINKIIKDQLLPHYEGIELRQEDIIAGVRAQ